MQKSRPLPQTIKKPSSEAFKKIPKNFAEAVNPVWWGSVVAPYKEF